MKILAKIIIIVFLLTASAFAITVSMPNISVGPGTTTVQIPINIDNGTGVAGFQFKIAFNNSVLNATGASVGTLTNGWTVMSNTNTPGQITVGGFSTAPISGGSGSLCILQFNVVGTPASSTNLNFTESKLTDFQAQQIAHTQQNGIFRIIGYSISGKVTLVGGTGQVTNVVLTLDQPLQKVTTNPDAQGNYSFTNLAPGQYIITPQLNGYAFTPANRQITVTNANVSNQNFTGNALASVSGTISYSGINQGGTFIGLFTSPNFSGQPAYSVMRGFPGTGPYTISNVAPGTYYAAAFMDLNGDQQWQQAIEPSGVYSGNPFTLSAGQQKTNVNITLKEPLTFTVNSAYGSPNPSVGQHTYYTGDSITASVVSPVSGPTGTRYVCTGWTGTGSTPANGTSTSTQFTITQNSTITWNWKTQYRLTYSANPSNGGTVTVNPQATGNWYDENTPVQLTATPNPNYVFLHWILNGEIVGENNNHKNGNPTLNIIMNQPHNVVAAFALNQPVLSVNPTNIQFYFNVSVDSTTKETEITIRNSGSGPGTLNWQINPANIVYQQGTGWIEINQVLKNGVIEGSLLAGDQQIIILKVDRTGKQVGEYNAIVPVTSNGGNVNISVKMIINQPPVAEALTSDEIRVETAVEFNARFTSNGGTITKSEWNFYEAMDKNRVPLQLPFKTIQITGAGNRIILPLSMFITREDKQGGMYAWSVKCWDSYGEVSEPDWKTFAIVPLNNPTFINPQDSTQIILPDSATGETALVRFSSDQGLLRIIPLRVASFPGASSVFANLFDIRVEDIVPGTTAMIIFEVPGSASNWLKYQYNNERQTWEIKTMPADDSLDEYAKIGVADTPGYTKILLQLKDGGQYDADGQENGVISDPSGPSTTQGIKISGGGGCFIATAAFGSYQEKHVWILRQFRDRYLLTNSLGTAFVKWYYKHSPKYATIIAKNNVLRITTRIALMPVYTFALIMLKCKILAFVFLTGILFVLTQKGGKWLRKKF